MNKQKAALVIAIIAAIFSVGIILYPLIGTFYNARHQSTVHSQYMETVAEIENQEIRKLRKRAREYNDLIRGGAKELGSFDMDALRRAQNGYKGQLNLLGDGVMGYIEIPKIGVQLPIFHGTDDHTLQLGAGHLLGTSLPVGGRGSHCVLTAHSGMAANRMFSDLPALEEGDLFILNTLGRELGYRVDQIKVTLPEETEALRIEREKDLCTLVTCTPFGVNTHRLLVRGSRIPDEELKRAQQETEQLELRSEIRHSVWESEYLKGIAIGIGIVLLAVLVIWSVQMIRKYSKR